MKHEIFDVFEAKGNQACDDGRAFAEKYDTLKSAWLACERTDWMLWLCWNAGAGKTVAAQISAIFALRVIHLWDAPECVKTALDALAAGKTIDARDARAAIAAARYARAAAVASAATYAIDAAVASAATYAIDAAVASAATDAIDAAVASAATDAIDAARAAARYARYARDRDARDAENKAQVEIVRQYISWAELAPLIQDILNQRKENP